MMHLLFLILMNVFMFWFSFVGAFTYSFCDTNKTNPSEFCAAYVQSFDEARK